jgi:hypothetical protein
MYIRYMNVSSHLMHSNKHLMLTRIDPAVSFTIKMGMGN